MPSGEAFTDAQISEIGRAARVAGGETGLHFSVFVGSAEGEVRRYAERLHAALGDQASNGVLVFVSPGQRRMEIVVGREARHRLDDRACALAAMSMCSAFTVGDLTGGLVTGLRMLAEAAGSSEALPLPLPLEAGRFAG
ncbi:MAG: DUF5130 family protein [Mycobacteriales bacterium]